MRNAKQHNRGHPKSKAKCGFKRWHVIWEDLSYSVITVRQKLHSQTLRPDLSKTIFILLQNIRIYFIDITQDKQRSLYTKFDAT